MYLSFPTGAERKFGWDQGIHLARMKMTVDSYLKANDHTAFIKKAVEILFGVIEINSYKSILFES